MGRRRSQHEHENHERWLVSYADFITLLFAFFVVMYAVSSVNEGKYRVLSDSLAVGFRGPPKSLEPIQAGSLTRSQALQPPPPSQRRPFVADEVIRLPDKPVPEQDVPLRLPPDLVRDPAPAAPEDPLDAVVRQVSDRAGDLIDDGLMSIRRHDDWVELELKQSVVFPTGSAAVGERVPTVLDGIADALRDLPNPVHVEGHADSTPISTPVYPSNWELSAARAASIVSFFMRQGMDPARLAAVGYGEHRPIASNDTVQGRAQNRRVVIVVHADHQRESGIDPTQPRDEDPGQPPDARPLQWSLPVPDRNVDG